MRSTAATGSSSASTTDPLLPSDMTYGMDPSRHATTGVQATSPRSMTLRSSAHRRTRPASRGCGRYDCSCGALAESGTRIPAREECDVAALPDGPVHQTGEDALDAAGELRRDRLGRWAVWGSASGLLPSSAKRTGREKGEGEGGRDPSAVVAAVQVRRLDRRSDWPLPQADARALGPVLAARDEVDARLLKGGLKCLCFRQ
jgi:hypothetical protein